MSQQAEGVEAVSEDVRRPRQRLWTTGELALVCAYRAAGRTDAEAAAALGRSRESVRHKARELSRRGWRL